MEIETKIENPAVKKRLNDLDSDDPKTIREAVNYLARQDKNKQLKTALREIVENFRVCESLAAIWAIAVLGIMRDKDAVPYLLDVFDSDEDFTQEAAEDTLVLIERAHPGSVVPLAIEFIERRIDNDPWRAKIFAVGVLGEFIDQIPVKNFLIKLFEKDKDIQDFIGSILVNTKDKIILELLKRSLVFFEQVKDDIAINEMKWHYYYLANGISYAEKYPDNKSWKRNWEQRWNHLLEKVAEGDDEGGGNEVDIEKMEERLKEMERKFKGSELDKQFQKELAERDAQEIEPFCLARWLEIRQRSDFENEFQRVLDLVGAGDIWQVEDIQKAMNESRSSGPIMKMISEKINFPDEKSFTAFFEYANQLWNNTPREELQGLTPAEKMEIYYLSQE
ncbi:MAG: HEAT repeat domain-containing protein [Candidatus Nealsonbacteria bacterium DGGOD1a]|jgi:hypothetical protein|nr:MAG: HEAT repeat domain-containing protein [Candidatus Nealsonbacteria bacterium DGGOD1a]